MCFAESDIGCGWCSIGRLLMKKTVRPYLEDIEERSGREAVRLYGLDRCCRLPRRRS